MDHICPNCGNLLACGYFRGLHVIGCAFCGLRGPGAPLDAPHPQAAIALFSRFFGPLLGFCEHGIGDGEWCELCNKAYKEARHEARYGEAKWLAITGQNEGQWQGPVGSIPLSLWWKMKRDPLANHCVCGGKHKRG